MVSLQIQFRHTCSTHQRPIQISFQYTYRMLLECFVDEQANIEIPFEHVEVYTQKIK